MLLRCYPRDWRRRYGREFGDLLARESLSPRIAVDLLRGALDAHLHPQQPSAAPSRLRRAASVVFLAAFLLMGGYLVRHPADANTLGSILRMSHISATATPVEHGFGQRGNRPE